MAKPNLKQSPFFEFLNRRDNPSFEHFEADSIQDEEFIDWNSHLMPYEYREGDAEFEYKAVREACALCDISPMRKIRITGQDASPFLDRLLTRPATSLDSNRAQYVVFCNDDGTLKDDAILYKFSPNDYLLLPSDIDHSPYFKAVAKQSDLTQIQFAECTSSLVGLALQGPAATGVALAMGFEGIDQLTPFEIRDMAINTSSVMVARMGFTADLGYEFWLKPEDVELMCDLISSVRAETSLDIPGYGLSALEACRIEGGFVVAGWDFATELDEVPGFERSPFEVGLAWTIDMDNRNFVGKEALARVKGNSRYLLRRLVCDQELELEGLDLFANINDEPLLIGSINCASWSWGQNATIGNASIFRSNRNIVDAWVEVEGKKIAIRLQKGGFVNFKRRNEVPAPNLL